MTNRIKFEQMLECLINEDRAKAEEIFHDIVVAKSREIYENLLDDDLNEIGGDESDDFMSDVGDEDEMGGDEEMGDEEEFGMDDDFGDEEGSDEPATKDDVLDIKDALEDLKAEFERLLAGEESEGEDEMGDEDFGMEEPEEPAEEGWQYEEAECDEDDDMDEEFVREYVEKVGNDWDKNAMKGEKNSPNTKSIVAGKNDMGGTTANIAKGGTVSEKGTAGGLANNKPQDMKTGNVNVPGGNAGKTGFKTKEPGHGAEKKGSSETNVNAKSILKAR